MANPKSTKMWFKKARQDLKTAKYLNPIEPDFYSGIVFHCQQSAEKAIKGFLTFHNVRVLKTHDMDKLLESISRIDTKLSEKYAPVKTFTLYAVEYRYPDAEINLPPLTEEIVQQALTLADQVFSELAELVSDEKNA